MNTQRSSLTWVTVSITSVMVIFVIIFANRAFVSAQETPFSLRLHTELTSGLTSCSMEAGNVFDLAHFAVVPPALVQQVRFYAQGFQGGSGAVIGHLYGADSLASLSGARLLATSAPVTVSGDSMSAFIVDFGTVVVDSRYVLASLEFSGATVIGASQSSLAGGRSFTTDCDLAGAAHMNNVVVETNWALGIELMGYTVLPATFTPVETEEPTAEATTQPTADVTAEATTEPTAEVTTYPTTAITAEPTVEITVQPTAESTAAPTLEASPETPPTSVASDTPVPSVTPTQPPAPTEPLANTPTPEAATEGTPAS